MEERSNSRSDVSVTSNLSHDRETPDQMIKTSSSSPIPAGNQSKLSFGITRFLNNGGPGSGDKNTSDRIRVTPDTDAEDRKSPHSEVDVERINNRINPQSSTPGSHNPHHPLNSMIDNPLLRGLPGHRMIDSMGPHPGQLGSPFSNPAFPWLGNRGNILFSLSLFPSFSRFSPSLWRREYQRYQDMF